VEWLIDPLAQTLEVLTRRSWMVEQPELGRGDPIRAVPFDALSLELGTLLLGASRD
jgi:hypothetical protein